MRKGKGDGPSQAERAEAVMAATAARLVDMLRAGVGDPSQWSRSWGEFAHGLCGAVNVATGHRYQGQNALGLAFEEIQEGRLGPWGTYQQWESVGGQVRKGEHATWILVPRVVKRDATLEERERTGVDEITRVFFGVAPVFPSTCQDGWVRPAVDRATGDDDRYGQWVDRVVAGGPVDVVVGDPSYSPAGDVVRMPPRDVFVDDVAWLGTFAHELTHWTGGRDNRVPRPVRNRFGEPGYALEELVAELGSAMVCATLGAESTPRADHVHYLASWLRAVDGDGGPDMVRQVAKVAQSAATFLVDLAEG